MYRYADSRERLTPQEKTDVALMAMWRLLEAEDALADLDTQFYGPGPRDNTEDAYQPYPMPPRTLIYEKKRDEINQTRLVAKQELHRLLGYAYGPRFDLNAETDKYIREQSLAAEQRAAVAAAQTQESPRSAFYSTNGV
tara:strand:- start:7818 stop:8234 length:417 start_codon:yes stop_codon:yes gene_type:complete